MSVARVVSIFNTDFKDFTFNTYNYCWPILEYGVAILVCCGPLLRPVLEKLSFTCLRNQMKGSGSLGDHTGLQPPGRLGFSQLGEGNIALQSMRAPLSVTSITGNAPRTRDHMKHENGVSKGRDPNPRSKAIDLPIGSITVESRWEVGSGNV